MLENKIQNPQNGDRMGADLRFEGQNHDQTTYCT